MHSCILRREILSQLQLVIVHQSRVRDDNQGGADGHDLAHCSGAWDEG